MRIGYLVETPITQEKKMYGAQISFVAMLDELMKSGVEPYVVVSEEWELSDALRARGVQVLITPIWEFFDSLDGVFAPVHDPEEVRQQSLASEQLIGQFFLTHKVQLVHMNTRFAGLIGARVARELCLPYVFHIREYLADDFGLAFKDQKEAAILMNGADRLIAISADVATSLGDEYPDAKIDVIYNGIEVERYSIGRKKESGTKLLRTVLLGRVVEHKGQMQAIEAIRQVERLFEGGVSLHIVGYRPDELSPYEQDLINFVEQEDLAELVKFVPFTSDVPEELVNYDVGLVCSQREAFGRVTIEYMMARLAVIGANSGATPELVRHGENGLLYAAGDSHSLALNLVALRDNRDTVVELAERAYDAASQRFTSEANAKAVFSLYASLVE